MTTGHYIKPALTMRSHLCRWFVPLMLAANWTQAQSSDGPAASAAATPHDVATTNERNWEARRYAAALINNIRNKLDACGENGMLATQGRSADATTRIPARPSLNWNPLLDLAATDHARSMARSQFFAHVDPQGRTVGHRVKRAGYRWRTVGENLAAGQKSVDEAIRGWLLSSSHCRILVDPRFTEFGLARADARNPLDPYRSYWALVVAQPRQPRRTN